jgi:hypothetical protein
MQIKITEMQCWWEYKLTTMETSMEFPQKTSKKIDYLMIQLNCSWTYIQRNVSMHTIDTPAQPSLQQYFS